MNDAGLFTDQQNPYDLAQLVKHGFKWLSFQAQNDTQIVDRQLGPARDAGLRSGVWGVTYSQANFERDGHALGAQALKLGADHVTVDAEECLKFTRATRGAQPLIAGIRVGGWLGPVNLSTLGAPANWSVNDFEMDAQSFLDTGGFVLPQAYLNDALEYRPDYCVSYWRRVGVPAGQLNVTIGLYTGKLGRIAGPAWMTELRPLGIGPAISIFMAQDGTPGDYLALEEAIQAKPVPPPPPQPTAAEVRKQMTTLARSWERTAGGIPTRTARITVARRIVGEHATDPRWSQVEFQIADLLDKAGIT